MSTCTIHVYLCVIVFITSGNTRPTITAPSVIDVTFSVQLSIDISAQDNDTGMTSSCVSSLRSIIFSGSLV